MASATTDRRLGLTGDKGFKAPVRAGTLVNIALSGEQAIDGVAVKAIGTTGFPDRVLVKNQTNPVDNGIWDVSTASWTRSLDANGSQDLVTGSGVTITEGSQAFQYWFVSTIGPIIPGSSSITFASGNPGLTALAASSGAGLVGAIASGTGPTATTIQARLRDLSLSIKADFDCRGDGVVDDTIKAQAFMKAQEINTRTGFIPDGRYSVTDIQLGDPASTGVRSGSGQGNGVYHLYGTDRQRAVFVARSGTVTVLQRNNLSGVKFSHFGVDGNGIANVGLDLSWVINGGYPNAPSNENVISDIYATSALITNININNVYDSVITNIRSVGAPIALSLVGGGGQLNLTNSVFAGLVQCAAQNLSISNTPMLAGLDINGISDNFINVAGSQIFAIGTSVSIPSYKTGYAIDATDSGTYGATLKLDTCQLYGGSTQNCIQGKFNLGLTAINSKFSYGAGKSLLGTITTGSTARPVMTFENCTFPAAGTPLGTNPSAYYWVMKNCFVGSTYVQYASNMTEGTWTPTIAGITTAGANTYTAQFGKWKRHDNEIHAYFDVQMSVKDAAMAGAVLLAGLPFAGVAGFPDGTAWAFKQLVTMTAGYTELSLGVQDGLPSAVLWQSGSGQAIATVLPAALANNARLRGVLIYSIA